MQLMSRGIWHPKFTKSMMKPVYGSMTSLITLRRSASVVDPAQPKPTWDYDAGAYTDGSDFSVLAQHVRARVEPGQDFRARAYLQANQTTVMNAVNVFIPATNIVWTEGLDDSLKFVLDEDQIIVESSFFPGLEVLQKYILKVRNPVPSDTDGWINLLCDIDLKSGISRVN